MSEFHIVIPCKALAEGKSRLASMLSPRQRYELCAALLRQTIDVAVEIVRPEWIWLTTPDDLATAVADKLGINVVPDAGTDLNAALDLARTAIHSQIRERDHGLMVLPIDLPLIDPTAIGRSIRAGAEVTIAADRAKTGTNFLYLKGPAIVRFPFSYGTNSFHRHCESARRHKYRLRIIDDFALAFDLDEPNDLVQLARAVPLTSCALPNSAA
jgi:2-phospho-L-lactate/phosphoenolpyruvate guanylyltransferase